MTINLHFQTVMVNMLVICTVCSIVIALILQKRRKSYPGLGRISAQFGLHALGLFFLVLQGTLPAFITSFLANALIAAGFYVGLSGIGALVERPRVPRLLVFAYLLFLVLHLYWIYGNNDIHLRTLNLSWIAMLFSLFSAERLLRPKDPSYIKFTRPCGITYLLFSGLLLIRFFLILTQRSLNQNYLESQSFEPVFFIIFQIAYVLMTFLLLVLVNKRLLFDREQALSEVRVLSGMLPICASCKNIRDDQGYWKQLEDYLHTHTEAQFSHSLCPDCAEKLYPELYEEIKENLT